MKKEVVKKTSTATKKKETVERAEETKVIQLSEVDLLADQLKEEHGEVFVTNIAGIQIIWRKLKRSEYKEIMDIIVVKKVAKLDEDGNPLLDEQGNSIMEEVDDFDATYDLRQELIAKAVILYPDTSIVDEMAACADVISTECMIKSGFGESPITEEC
jgi:hypothetical protein